MKPVLIVGGGITGITAAVEIAEAGFPVVLVEKGPYLGGNVALMNRYFPKLCPPHCGLEINYRRIRQNSLIRVHVSTTVSGISGTAGNYRARLRSGAAMINTRCTSCGNCVNVCPVSRPDPLLPHMNHGKAVYSPGSLSYPPTFTIDSTICLKKECGKCSEACTYKAVDLDAEPMETEISVSSVILASGWQSYPSHKLQERLFPPHPDIISNMQMERLCSDHGPTGGKLIRPSDGRLPRITAFIQCVGSRDENHLEYCSGVCCSASLKQAIWYTGNYPGTEAVIFYIDLRVSGRNEDFLNRARESASVRLIRGKASTVRPLPGGNIVVEAENIETGKKITQEAELVVLAQGIVPLTPAFLDKQPANIHGFLNNRDLPEGFYTAGCLATPMDVSSAARSAAAAALKAIQTLKRYADGA